MNYNSPDSGSTSYQNMYWGGYEDDISSPILYQVPTGNTSNGIPTGETYSAYLPSDKFSGTQCAHDTDVSYYNTSYAPIPSPYLTNGSRNPGYYQTSSPSSSNNALADFDGIGNSQVLWDLATSQSSWKTESSITNNSGSGYYPAACCCWRYHTEGTSQGDWYLPACGELGYIMPPFNKINDAIDKMRTVYGSSVGVELNNSDFYWSSTEYSSNDARFVNTSYGRVSKDSKNSIGYVRAFLKVSPLDLSGISPESAPNGTYIYASNGKLYSKEQWDTTNNDSAVGVAVIQENSRFIISKDLPMKNNIEWSEQISSTDVEGILTTDDEEIAKTDYAGKNNTDLIISNTENENSSNNAAHYCILQEMNGNKGYLPSSGELYKIWENKDVIDQILILIGSKSIYDKAYEITNLPPYFWSSTEYRSDKSWFLYWTRTSSPLVHEYKGMKTSRLTAFPVFPLISGNPEGGIDPESAKNGVYIYKNDGKLYDSNKWNTENNENALGVAVVTENCKFVINKELPMTYGIPWSYALHGEDVDGLTNYSTSQEAMTDYSGQYNTDIIRSAAPEEDSSNNAAHYCYVQTMNGQHGYLPSAGELAAMHNNKGDINESLVLIGSKSIDDRCDEFQTMSVPYLWSSTSQAKHYAYRLDWSSNHISMIYQIKGDTESSNYAFPVFPLA